MNSKTFLTAAVVAMLAAGAAFAETAPEGTAKPEGSRHGGVMFEKSDTDKDGGLNQDEFLAVHVKRFEKLDKNGDGTVTKAEFLEQFTKKFSDIDANQDGKIMKEEMQANREAMKEKMREAKKSAAGKQADVPSPAEKKK